VVRLVVYGLTNEEISVALGIAQRTVRNHLSSVFKKWQVRNRVEAAIIAFRKGLITPDEAYRQMGYGNDTKRNGNLVS
jgi:DNA-binding NarL/FixJ family response regulator